MERTYVFEAEAERVDGRRGRTEASLKEMDGEGGGRKEGGGRGRETSLTGVVTGGLRGTRKRKQVPICLLTRRR
jgi:hypothetical protein